MRRAVFLSLVLLGAASPAAAQWAATSGPAGGGAVRALLSTGDAVLAGTQTGGLFRTRDGGQTWAPLLPDVPAVGLAAPAIGVLLVAAEADGVYRSDDDGATWALSNDGLVPGTTASALAVSDRYVLVATSDGVYFSEDDGQSWTPTTVGVVGWRAAAVVADGAEAYAYVLADGPATTGFYRADDGGRVWEFPFSLNRNDIRTLAARGSDLFAGGLTSAAVFWSHNRGEVFFASTGLPEGSGGFAFALGDGTTAYVGHIEGVHSSADDGVVWAPFSDGLPPGMPPHPYPTVDALAIHDGYLYAGLHEGGVWRRLVGTPTGAAPGASSPPAALSLSEATPNPFSSSARLTLRLAEAQAVRVEVVDALGRRVALLHDGPMAAGTHTLALDGSALPGGVYVVRAAGATAAASRRVTLLR